MATAKKVSKIRNYSSTAEGEPNSSPITEKTSLRSRFNLNADGRLEQGRAYFPGGMRDLKNVCTLTCSACDPQTITLYLSPNNVSWDYMLRTHIIDTYGGQVVQILGVSVENLTIQGFFGSEGMWGYNLVNSSNGADTIGSSRFNDGDSTEDWKEEGKKLQNGLYQFSQWFKSYFYTITQQGNFNKSNMIFKYPHMGWEWHIRPLSLPKVRFANDEFAPQWELQCDFIEDFQGTFTQQVTESAKTQVSSFRNGVGFSEFIEWSEPVYKNQQERSTLAGDIGSKYSEFISQDLTDSQLKTLITQGYSYPASNKNNIESKNYAAGTATISASVLGRLKPLLDTYNEANK